MRRSQIDHINYEIIESIKNGCVFSTKYNSTPKLRLGGTKVIVFMNAMPDKTKLSSDRYHIFDLTNLLDHILFRIFFFVSHFSIMFSSDNVS